MAVVLRVPGWLHITSLECDCPFDVLGFGLLISKFSKEVLDNTEDAGCNVDLPLPLLQNTVYGAVGKETCDGTVRLEAFDVIYIVYSFKAVEDLVNGSSLVVFNDGNIASQNGENGNQPFSAAKIDEIV